MKKVWFFALVVAVFSSSMLFSGCASLTGRTAGEIIDDSVITTEINAKIVKDPELSYFKINVNSTNGGKSYLLGMCQAEKLKTISSGLRKK
jgi:osmotically-inducible protein OsmY